MLGEMTAEQLHGWLAYSQIDPFGEERADLRAGIVAATIANVNRGKNQRAFRPGDFMADFRPREQQSPEALKMMIKWAASKQEGRR